jgi:hypothetical protein
MDPGDADDRPRLPGRYTSVPRSRDLEEVDPSFAGAQRDNGAGDREKDPGPPRMAGRTGSSPGARPGRRRARTGRRVERRRGGGRAPAPGRRRRRAPAMRQGRRGTGRAAPRLQGVNLYRATSPSGGHSPRDSRMDSGEPLAGRRSEVMSTSRESHRVASRTLDLERRLRVLSAQIGEQAAIAELRGEGSLHGDLVPRGRAAAPVTSCALRRADARPPERWR